MHGSQEHVWPLIPFSEMRVFSSLEAWFLLSWQVPPGQNKTAPEQNSTKSLFSVVKKEDSTHIILDVILNRPFS